MGKQEPMNAEDLLAELANDAGYQERIERKNLEKQSHWQLLDEDQRELVSECCAVGVEIESVWDLVNTEKSYRAAIPVLVRHLEIEHHPKTIEGIVRALSTPEASGHAQPLIRLFLEEKNGDSEFKWLLGAAIAETATSADAFQIAELIEDSTHGIGREFLPLALIHSPKKSALAFLETLLKNSVMAENAAKAIHIIQNTTA